MNATRRTFIEAGAAGLLLNQAGAQPAAETLAPWTMGTLDIHHISTGRGSCAFLMCPDGSTMMVDCGALEPEPDVAKFIIDPKPNGTRRPGEWVARYIARHMKAARREALNVFLLTHFHMDYMGQYSDLAPRSKHGRYRLSGITDVAEVIPVRRVFDRGWPDYQYPEPLTDPHQKNFQAFVKSGSAIVERFQRGRLDQIDLRQPNRSPNFHIRNLVANGEVWTGAGESARNHSLNLAFKDLYPVCSLGIRLNYGEFGYLSAGDMCFNTQYESSPWRDIETPVARASGLVDVAVANHHGYVDATGPAFVAALRPRAFIINTWDSAHPTMGALENMLSPDLYPGERAILATAMKPESKIAIRQLAKLRSDNGHVVFRVSAPGNSFEVFVTSNADESDRVIGRFGPYVCGAGISGG